MTGLHPVPAALTAAAAAGALGAAGATTVRATLRNRRMREEVRRRLADTTHQRVSDLGSVDRLVVLPLVDRAVARDDLRGEFGVSYLVRADRAELLFDAGLNLLGRRRSPLVANAEALGVDLAQIPAVVLSHGHEDHVGGVRAARAGTFAYSGARVEPPGLLAHAPVPLTHAVADVRTTTRTTRLAPGVAVLPPLAAAMFWDKAPVLEQALVVDVRGVGLVLLSGCGHPGIPAMVDVVRQVLDRPLHAVVGGLHLPVHPGPEHLVQALTGSRPPWDLLGDRDVGEAVDQLRSTGVSTVAVSGHDSTGHTMRRFGDAFGSGFREIRVGEELVFTATSAAPAAATGSGPA